MKFFARARDLTGCDTVTWTVPPATCVEPLRRRLATEFPAIAVIASHLFVAINGDYASDETIVRDGDEVAFFPPVSGG